MEKNYLYHAIPENLKGGILYPLNQLKSIYPENYNLIIEKYKNRLEQMELKIPMLSCLWNDVIHLSPVHPEKINQALKEIRGFGHIKRKWYKIDAKLLDPQSTIVYLYPNEDLEMGISNFTAYDPNTVNKYSAVPEETKTYYKRCTAAKRETLAFHRIPHVLYKGVLNINQFETIDLDEQI